MITDAAQFLSFLSDSVPRFVQSVEHSLAKNHNLNVSMYPADHVCWRTETQAEYTELVAALNSASDNFQLLIESNIGGRPIATFALTNGIEVPGRGSKSNKVVDVIEIPSPKNGRPYTRGLEHVEFVIGNDSITSPMNGTLHQSVLNQFMEQHADVKWDTKAKAKPINPDVSLMVKLEGFGACSVKFHLMPLSKVIEYEKSNQMTTNVMG